MHGAAPLTVMVKVWCVSIRMGKEDEEEKEEGAFKLLSLPAMELRSSRSESSWRLTCILHAFDD